MNKELVQDPEDRDNNDPFRPYRQRIVYSLAIASAVILLPFTINHFVEHRPHLGVAMLSTVVILIVDAHAIHHGKAPPIPPWALVLPVLATLLLAVLEPLYVDLVWAYPTVALFYFILPRRTANVLTAVITVAVSVLAYVGFARYGVQMRIATRMAAALGLVAILCNLFISIISDLQRKLRRQSITDPLTGAYNRRHMDTVLSDAYARTRRGAPAPTLLLMDIDHFKTVNDDYGHSMGDRVLQGIASVIQRHVRFTDMLFRYGGEEFILFLPETSLEGAAIVAEEVRRAVAEARLLESRQVTISIGAAALAPGETLDDWLRHGDAALYRAKAEGRNRVSLHPEDAPEAAPRAQQA